MAALDEDPKFSRQTTERGLTSAAWTPGQSLVARTATLTLVSPAQDAAPVRADHTHLAEADDAPSSATPQAEARCVRDAQLAACLQRTSLGDQQAFTQFYDTTVGYAQALARRMVNAADLEDVLADAYLHVWRKAAGFDAARGSAVTWLLLIVRSRALDLLRKPREELLEDGAPELATEDAGPPDLLETTQGSAALHAALAQLNAKERWVLSLAYYKDMSHADIAAATGMPLGTVKSLINRAQEKLRVLLHASTLKADV